MNAEDKPTIMVPMQLLKKIDRKNREEEKEKHVNDKHKCRATLEEVIQ